MKGSQSIWNAFDGRKSMFIALTLLMFSLGIGSAQDISLDITMPCKSEWSDWSPCYIDPKADNWKERVLELQPAQAEGEHCDASVTVNMVEKEECKDTDPNTENLPSDLTDTDCSTVGLQKCSNGRCVDPKLFCNFEDDCGDGSDEYPINTDPGCTKITDTSEIYICGLNGEFGNTQTDPAYLERWLRSVPGLSQFATGFDILTGKSRSAVLDMSPHGSCRKVLIEGVENEFYRLPANVASYRQLTSIKAQPAEIYSSGASLMESLRHELRYNPNKAGLVNELTGRVGMSQQDQVKQMMTKNFDKETSTVYVKQNVEVTNAEVTLQHPKDMVLSTEFVSRLMELPTESFSHSRYLSLIEDFGTHYASVSNLGGTYRQVQGYSRCWIEHGSYEKYSSKLFTEVLPVCVAESFYYQLNEQSTFSDDCTRNSDGTLSLLFHEADTNTISTLGGSLMAASSLGFDFQQTTWNAWIESIKEYPALNTEKFKLLEITELMQSKVIPMDLERRSAVKKNLEKAIGIYLGAYDAQEKCAKCSKTGDYTDEFINGTAYLSGTGQDYKCYCSYDDVPTEYTCASTTPLSQLMCVLLAAVLATLMGQC